ncbi:DVU3141 family protein [Nitrococcus mobilis]|uniref:Uncharacterized protein n=1 Tax=Nitrococcus mobilis Nb-231 TaxID=314278 RepID=A4BRU7_9GAMM|nr:DVU3141 family protein [Nitrococcus mobilis]EAR21668.1 hypothetical protein NB231_02838 [Nitrococcus mobilis Nb-231]
MMRIAVFQGSFLCVAFVGVSACVTLPPSAPRSALPAAFETFLASAPAGGRVVLADSPWGPEATVYAHAPYYAASGRTCRELTIELTSTRRPGLVCQLPHGAWESVRVLSHSGRPVFSLNAEQPHRRGTN